MIVEPEAAAYFQRVKQVVAEYARLHRNGQHEGSEGFRLIEEYAELFHIPKVLAAMQLREAADDLQAQ